MKRINRIDSSIRTPKQLRKLDPVQYRSFKASYVAYAKRFDTQAKEGFNLQGQIKLNENEYFDRYSALSRSTSTVTNAAAAIAEDQTYRRYESLSGSKDTYNKIRRWVLSQGGVVEIEAQTTGGKKYKAILDLRYRYAESQRSEIRKLNNNLFARLMKMAGLAEDDIDDYFAYRY